MIASLPDGTDSPPPRFVAAANRWRGPRYPVRQVGGRDIRELWVPAEELDLFNRHLVGRIEVVHEFRAAPA